jgi:hypothetical protein
MRALAVTARLAGTVVVLLLALLTAAWAATGRMPLTGDRQPAMPRVGSSDLRGPLVRASASQTLFQVTNLQPGTARIAQLTIANTGTTRGVVTFSPAGLTDLPAGSAEPLSRVLEVVMQDATNRFAPVTLWTGVLADLGPVVLGTFDPGQARTYRFTVRYPTGRPNAADDAQQGASTSVVFNWDGSFEDAPPAARAGGPAPAAPVAARSAAPPPPPAPAATPRPAAPPRPAARLRVTWLSGREQRRGVRVRVTCPAACAGTLHGTVRIGRSAARVRARRIAQRAGTTRTWVLRLAPAPAARAARAYRTGGRATAVVTLRARGTRPVTGRAVLRRPTFGGTMAP